LEYRGVEFVLGHNISHIGFEKNQIQYIVLDNHEHYHAKNLVLAMPPMNLVKCLSTCEQPIQDAFGDLRKLDEWSKRTEYITYISITYHFKNPINIETINGLTIDTDYGIVVINLSDYMPKVEDGFAKVLSAAISICDRPSKHTGKTANECSEEELYKETFRQMKTSLYPDLHDYDLAIINPNSYYDSVLKQWKTIDSAFLKVTGTEFLPFHSQTIKNLYNLGVQNGHDYIGYATMESAVSNAMSLSCILYPELHKRYYVRKFWRIRDMIIFLIVIICIILVIALIQYT